MSDFSLSAALSFGVEFYVLCQCYDESIFAVVLGALLGFFTGIFARSLFWNFALVSNKYTC